MKTQDVAVEDPGASEQSARSSLTRSLSAVTSVLVSPRSAFVEIRTGIQLWVPVLLIAMYRVCWLYVQYAPGRRLDKVMLNLGVQAVIVVAEYAALALPLFTLLWIQGGKFALRSLFAVLLTAASVCELGSLIAALVGRAFSTFLRILPGRYSPISDGSSQRNSIAHCITCSLDSMCLSCMLWYWWRGAPGMSCRD